MRRPSCFEGKAARLPIYLENLVVHKGQLSHTLAVYRDRVRCPFEELVSREDLIGPLSGKHNLLTARKHGCRLLAVNNEAKERIESNLDVLRGEAGDKIVGHTAASTCTKGGREPHAFVHSEHLGAAVGG